MGIFLLTLTLILVFILIGIPISFSLAGSALISIFFFTDVSLSQLFITLFDSTLSFPLLALPLFMFVGGMLERSGVGTILIDFCCSIVGWVKGGLAMVNILVSMFFGTMSGSSVADVASIGALLIPEMKKRGYPANFAVAVTSSSSCLSTIIPPSILMILYGVIAQVSITRLFLGGVVPGLILTLGQMAISGAMATKYNYPVHEPFSMPNVWKMFKKSAASLLIPITILGGILGGIFTPTEAAAAGTIVTFIVVFFVYKTFSLKDLPQVIIDTARQSGIVLLMVSTAGLLSWFITYKQLGNLVVNYILIVTDNIYIILFLINILLFISGCLLSNTASVVLLGPILAPIASKLGLDPVHFGLIMMANLTVASQTPPVAATLFLACMIGKTSLQDVMKVNKYFILLNLIVTLIVTYVPITVLYLPKIILD